MSTTLHDAVESAYKTLLAKPIFGLNTEITIEAQRKRTLERIGKYDHDVFHRDWKRGWGISATLNAKAVPGERRGKPIWLLECEVSWSSTGHSVASALCAITLYREVAELAALLETQWAQYPPERETP